MDSQPSTVNVEVSKTRKNDSTKADLAKVASDQKTADRSDAATKKSSGAAKTAKKNDKSKKAKSSKKASAKPLSVINETDPSDSDAVSDESSSEDEDSTGTSGSSSSDEADARKKKRLIKKRQTLKSKKSGKVRKPKKSTRTIENSGSSSDSGSDSDVSDSGSDRLRSSGSKPNGNPVGISRGTHHSRDNRTLLRQSQQQSHLFNPTQQQLRYDPYQQYAAPMYYGQPYGSTAGIPMGAPPLQPPTSHNFVPIQSLGGLDPRDLRRRPHISSLEKLLSLQKDARRSAKGTRSKTHLDFKRVDQIWDSSIHNYKLQDTAEGLSDAEYAGYLFHVRRTFDWEGKYKKTVVDIKSKLLRTVLQEVMGDIKGISLVEDTPKLDPNMLFLYLDDLTEHLKTLEKAEPSGDEKTFEKQKRVTKKKQKQLKILVNYLNKDYEPVRKSLYPLLEHGLITFELLWALWKPNTLAYATTYGSTDDPRVFKVERAEKQCTMMKGGFYYVEGKYFEYDGKRFGFGNMAEDIEEFSGTRKITSLPAYPLKYHRNEAQLREELITRGKKFVALSGVQYKSYDGMAYFKKKKSTVKVSITGRIMIDASIHRRINPNYPVSIVRPNDRDMSSDDDSEGGWAGTGGCVSNSDDDGVQAIIRALNGENDGNRTISAHEPGFTEIRDFQTKTTGKAEEAVGSDGVDGDTASTGTPDGTDKDLEKPVSQFSDEEYLIASPIVLGFAFAEKMWLELTVSNVNEIKWNETAYESLVLEPKTKDIVKALVESHKYHAAESIDDVIQGKGKGLVAVLHGPPGTGKTLTAEGISELLKCPLYMVSAGELGTDSRFLEAELQRILDICHAWGAILLLDEADVFLEKRNMHDIHRNALVSIFLRQLEYFQGILFLTTNRVETFDDAFQSRIHIALRYGSLDQRAKKAIFKIFVERVRVLEKIDLMPFTEEDYNTLARHELNGRQIKNTVRTAQALAVNKGEPLSMTHIKQVLNVQMSFDRDLKGGPGFQDAMRSYF